MKQYTYVGVYRNELHVREIVNGQHQTRIEDFAPSLFIEKKEVKKTGWRNIYGKPLERMDFDNIRDFKNFLWDRKESLRYICGNKNVEYHYINQEHANREQYDPNALHVCYFDIEVLRDRERGYAPPENPFNSVCLITSYFPFLAKEDQIQVFALDNKEYRPNPEVNYRIFKNDKKMIEAFFKFLVDYEVDIVTGWNIENYDIPYLCGRYLGLWDENKETKSRKTYSVDTTIAPFGIINRKEVPGAYEKMNAIFEIVGISTLDYMGLYKKYTYVTQESYSLNNICSVELGEKKVDYSEMQHLQELYEKDYDKFVRYGIKDTLLVHKLDEKLQFINLAATVSYIMGCNFSDVASPVRSWEVFLYHEMMADYIVPPIEKIHNSNNKDGYIGAYVQDPVRGKHEWCLSFDFASLYPHIMIFANMSPETHVKREDMNTDQKLLYQNLQANVDESIELFLEHKVDTSVLKERNVTLTPNGAMFSKEVEGILPRIMKKLYAGRNKTKKIMLNNTQSLEDLDENEAKDEVNQLKRKISALFGRQMAIKIVLNSCYGGTGNEHFLFYNTDIAEGITSMGQLAIRYTGQELTTYLNDLLKTPGKVRILAGDTDSNFVYLGDLAEKFKKSKPDITDQQIADLLDKFANEKIQPFLNEIHEKLRDYLNGYEQSLKMKREKIAKSIIFVQKKRYTVAIIDNEGVRYHDMKISTTGLESVRSTTPEVIRKKLHEFEKILLLGTEDEAHSFLTQMKKDFRNYKIEEIAMVKSVNDIEKWVNSDRSVVKSGTPLQVKAATLYNKIMLEHDPHASIIASGDKIHLVNIKKSMRFLNETCIAYPQVIPPELGLTRDLVDWNMMYEKVFLSAAQILMGALGMEARKRTAVSLSSFFA